MVASDAKYSKWQPSFWIRAAKAGKTWRQKAQKTTTRFFKLKSMISTMQNYCKFFKNGWHNFFSRCMYQKQRYHLFCNIIGSIILTQEVVKVLRMFDDNKNNSVDSSIGYIISAFLQEYSKDFRKYTEL